MGFKGLKYTISSRQSYADVKINEVLRVLRSFLKENKNKRMTHSSISIVKFEVN